MVEHVLRFIKKHQLLGPQRKVLLGLSGGADSMLLAHVLWALKEKGEISSLRFLHIDHGLRKESHKQAETLKSWGDSWGWNIEIMTLREDAPKSNIENWARKKRRALLKDNLKQGEVLFLAHHIDDSFEWYLRSLLGSSQGRLVMGIPVINGPVRRPFHCLSKKQIESLVEESSLPTIVDSSNEDTRFQRNAVRKKVSRELFEIFPKGLAHYVERANQWAYDQNRMRKTSSTIQLIEYGKEESYLDLLWKKGERVLSFDEEQFAKEKLVESIKRFSKAERGELRQNVGRVMSAFKRGQNCGVFRFSGGVRVKVYPHMILIFHESFFKIIEKLWGQIKIDLGSHIPKQATSLTEMVKEVEKGQALPFVVYRGRPFGIKGLKEDDFLAGLLDENSPWQVRPMAQLEVVAHKQNRLSQPIDGFCVAF